MSGRRFSDALALLDGLERTSDLTGNHCSLVGSVYLAAEQFQRALPWLDEALRLDGALAETMLHRARALEGLDRLEEACEAFERAAASDKSNPVVHYSYANLLRRIGRLEDAIASYDTALRLRPAFPEALRAGGDVLRDLGHGEAALSFYFEAIRLRPGFLDAVLNCGNHLYALGRSEDALAVFEAALIHAPENALLHNNRGIVLHELGRLDDALQGFDTALAVAPGLAQAHLNRANVLVKLGRAEPALGAAEAALNLRPDYAEALCTRGVALKLLGRFDDALASFEAALLQAPDFAHARLNRGELRLLLGDAQRGWPDYDFRLFTERQTRPALSPSVPQWPGATPPGTRVIVFADQGNGDMIQFARYVPLVAATGAQVTLYCAPRMQRLLQGAVGPVRLIDSIPPADEFDYQIQMSSLPVAFNTTFDAVPGAAGYLRPEADLVARWSARLAGPGLKVGVCWKGSQTWRADPERSIPLAGLVPLADVPGVRLISLQRPDSEQTGDERPESLRIEDLGSDLDGGPDAFIDTAAVIANLDVVVTCDTAIAHLAGALGRPVWVLLKTVPEWRWMLERETSPWYASARHFRQTDTGDWTSPIADVAAALRGMAAERGMDQLPCVSDSTSGS